MRPDPPTCPVSATALAASLLRDGVTVRLPVRGRSMWPALTGVAEVEIAPTTGGARFGDIVLTAPQGQGPRLHRLVRRVGDGQVQTRGDACLRLDPPVPTEAIVGRVCRVRTRGGRWRGLAPAALRQALSGVLLGVSWVALRVG